MRECKGILKYLTYQYIFLFTMWKKNCREFFMLDNLLWGISCKVSSNPIICCHQTYPVNLAFIGLLTFEFLFPNKLKKHFITLLFLLKQLLAALALAEIKLLKLSSNFESLFSYIILRSFIS